MKKLSIQDLRNIKPVGIPLKLEFETENGLVETTEIKVYPLKVEEKVVIQQLRDNIKQYQKKKTENLTDEELVIYEKGLNDMSNKYIYFTFRKVFDEFTEEDVANIPKAWYTPITNTVLKAEGLDVEQLQKEKN